MIQIMLAIALAGVAIGTTIQAGRKPAHDAAVVNLAAQVNQLVAGARLTFRGNYADLDAESAYTHNWLPVDQFLERDGVWQPYDFNTGALISIGNWDAAPALGLVSDPVRDGMASTEGFVIAVTGIDRPQCADLARVLSYPDVWVGNRHMMRDFSFQFPVRRLGIFCRVNRDVFISAW